MRYSPGKGTHGWGCPEGAPGSAHSNMCGSQTAPAPHSGDQGNGPHGDHSSSRPTGQSLRHQALPIPWLVPSGGSRGELCAPAPCSPDPTSPRLSSSTSPCDLPKMERRGGHLFGSPLTWKNLSKWLGCCSRPRAPRGPGRLPPCRARPPGPLHLAQALSA